MVMLKVELIMDLCLNRF